MLSTWKNLHPKQQGELSVPQRLHIRQWALVPPGATQLHYTTFSEQEKKYGFAMIFKTHSKLIAI